MGLNSCESSYEDRFCQGFLVQVCTVKGAVDA